MPKPTATFPTSTSMSPKKSATSWRNLKGLVKAYFNAQKTLFRMFRRFGAVVHLELKTKMATFVREHRAMSL